MTILWGAWVLLTLVGVYFTARAAVEAWQRRQEHTRERFAFTALRSVGASIVLLISVIRGEGSLVLLIVQVVNEVFGTRFVVPESAVYFPSISLVAALVIVQAGLAAVFFRDWNGRTSIAARRRGDAVQHGLSGPLRAAYDYLATSDSREPAPSSARLSSAPEPAKSRRWEARARDLWLLKHGTYTFDQYHMYHEIRGGFWSGTIAGSEHAFVLLCVEAAPDDAALLAFLARANALPGVPAARCEYHVAVERGKPPEAVRTIGGATIHLFLEAQALDGLIDLFSGYTRTIRDRVAEKQYPNGWMLRETYARSKVDGGADLSAVVQDWLRRTTTQQLAVLGDYGSGKSVAALMLCYELLKASSPPRLPIMIRLRGQSPRNLKRGDLFALWGGDNGVNPRALEVLHESGRLLLIFEGLDEMDLAGDLNVCSDHMRRLWAYDGKDAKLLFTTRANFAFGAAESAELLGGERCARHTLDPFGLDDVATVLEPSEHREPILALARTDGLFRELLGRPFFVPVVSALWPSLQKQPRVNAATAMQLYLEQIYQREAEREVNRKADQVAPNFRLTTAERRYFMRGIATFMTLDRATATYSLTRDQYEEVMADLFRKIPDGLKQDTAAAVVNDEPYAALRERLPAGVNGDETLRRLVLTRGLLANDEADSERICFSQKVFMEYLAADARAQYMLIRNAPRAGRDAPSFVTDSLILDCTDDSWTVRWFAEILLNNAAHANDAESAACRRLFQLIVYPERGRLMALRARAAWAVLRYGRGFWAVMGLCTLGVMYTVWEFVLQLNNVRRGVAPFELLWIILAVFMLVVIVDVFSHHPRFRPSNVRKLVLVGSVVVVSYAWATTLWPFAMISMVLLLLLWNYATRLPWMRVWAQCSAHLGHSDDVKCEALGLPALPWWVRDMRSSALFVPDNTGSRQAGSPTRSAVVGRPGNPESRAP